MGLFLSSGFCLPLSRGRIRAAVRWPAAPRGRARRLSAACRPILMLRGCPASCRARRGILPVERSAPLPLLPNVWVVAGGAATTPWVVGRSGDGAWHGVAPAARQRSAVRRGFEVWAHRSPIGNRDCHVSRVARTVNPVLVLFCSWASSLFGAGRPFFVPSPAIRLPERAQGVKGPKRGRSLAACRPRLRPPSRGQALAQLVFRSALTPEHAKGRWIARRAFLEATPTSDRLVVSG